MEMQVGVAPSLKMRRQGKAESADNGRSIIDLVAAQIVTYGLISFFIESSIGVIKFGNEWFAITIKSIWTPGHLGVAASYFDRRLRSGDFCSQRYRPILE